MLANLFLETAESLRTVAGLARLGRYVTDCAGTRVPISPSCREEFWHHTPVMPGVGIADHGAQRRAVGGSGGFPFFHQIAQRSICSAMP